MINNSQLALNKPQQEAVSTFDKPILVLAGAGSGKTRVIAAKIAEILNTQRAEPFQILAVTFTNKAANEMLERVNKVCSVNTSYLNIGTFHSICVKMLRSFANLVNFQNNFLIADTSDQKKIIKDILSRLQMDPKTFPPSMILSFISRIKEKFITPEEFLINSSKFPNFYKESNIAAIYAEYQSILKNQNMMDFDDLLFFTTKLLNENPQVLEQYQQKFKYILIDEYQDINALQFKWFKLLADGNSNICAVGDDDQSIYGWRGADVSIILSFAQEFKNAQIIKLEQNYRSTKNIISVAESIISNNQNRLGKTLFTEEEEGDKVKITAFNDSKTEAREIANQIQKMHNNQTANYKDCAVLVRASSQTRILEEAFIAFSIPYKIIGGLKFYERKEIKDILSYIKAINNTVDDISFERILQTPKKGIGITSIDRILDYSRKNKISLMQACFNISGDDPFIEGKIIGVKAYNILCNFVNLIKKYQTQAMGDMQTFISSIVKLIEEIKYIEFLKAEDEDNIEARTANINELLNSMQSFESVDEFLEHISLVSSLDEEDENWNTVKILTIHAAKGLEFVNLFLPGWEEGLFPSMKTINDGGASAIEEERRLAYVAITRARKKLFLSYTKMRMIYGGFNPTKESLFIAEIKQLDSVDFRDKTFGSNSSFDNQNSYYKEREYSNKRDSFAFEIQNKKINVINLNSIVKHKIFGIGKVNKKINDKMFEVIFEEDLIRKTIKGDFLEFIKQE
jgi:DNA helicase II / ATP-dependent DNA helicase PcrA